MIEISMTNTDKIRAVLGLSIKEMPDKQLSVRDLALELDMDLTSWIPNLSAIENGSTDNEMKLLDAIGLYATYFCAKLVIPSLQMASLQKVSDGKNSADRFSPVDWDKLYDRTAERAAFYKKFILDNNAEKSTFTFKAFSAVGSAYDPVTGV